MVVKWSVEDIEKMKQLLASGDMDNIKLVEQMASPRLLGSLVDSIYGILLEVANIKGRDIQAIDKLFSKKSLPIFITLTSLPESIGKLQNLECLSLYGGGIINLPESIGDLSQLRVLDLSNHNLSVLPESIGNLNRLETLYLHRKPFSSRKESIANLSEVQDLPLSYNNLSVLPESIEKLNGLEHLFLEGNDFSIAEQKRIKKMLPKCEIHF